MRLSPRLVALIVLFALCALPARSVHAAGDPDLQWWTIETTNFRIHYERDLEPIARRVARLSESIHARLIGPLGHEPGHRTELALTDTTDIANGSATGLPYNAVRLFVTAPGDLSPLGDYDDWYLSLMTHEYTHILHVDNISGLPSLVNAILGKTLAPNQFQPRWILEGLAVVEETRFTSGGRLRGSLYDMYMRADVLEDRILGLDQLSSGPYRWPGGTAWYLYGSQFMRWIADVYGEDALWAMAADYGAQLLPLGINRSIRRVTGRTYPQLYKGFIKSLKRRYQSQRRRVRRRGLRHGRRITHHGQFAAYPTWRPSKTTGRDRLVYFRDDGRLPKGQYEIELRNGKRLKGSKATLIARTKGKSPATFTPDGDLIFSSILPHRRIYQFHDLLRLPAGIQAPDGNERTRQRLTRAARARDPNVSPNGRHIVFTTNQRGTTTLKIASVTAEGDLKGIRTLVASRRFDQVFTPVFSPDGNKVAYSVWTRGGFRDLRWVDLQTKKVEQLTRDRALDTGPSWSPDGKTLYFSSDRTGIFNIYALDVASRNIRQVTNVENGAMMPSIHPSGTKLAYVGYTSRGYDLFVMPLKPSEFLPATASYDRPDPPPEGPKVKMVKRPYQPLSTLKPRNFTFEYAPGNFGPNALTFTVQGQDIAGHHDIAASIVADPGAPLPAASLAYRYLRLPVDLSVSLRHGVTPRKDYRFSDQTPRYVEQSIGITTGLSYTSLHEFGSQRLGLSHNFSLLDADLPVASVGFDPWAQPTVDPLRGSLSYLQFSYNLALLQGARQTAGLRRGFFLGLNLDFGDESIGSEQSILAGRYVAAAYLPMPWPGDHTLAIRSSGGMATGTYSRRGYYFVGGYNLESTNILDTLTGAGPHGAFVLRGYPPSALSGRSFMLQNAEYRMPLVKVDRGPSTLPVYLRRIDANLFVDFGGAFDKLDTSDIKFFTDGAIISSPQLQTSAGGELWFGTSLVYGIDTQFRLGYARGLGPGAIPDGQLYFVASNAY